MATLSSLQRDPYILDMYNMYIQCRYIHVHVHCICYGYMYMYLCTCRCITTVTMYVTIYRNFRMPKTESVCNIIIARCTCAYSNILTKGVRIIHCTCTCIYMYMTAFRSRVFGCSAVFNAHICTYTR